MALQQRFAHLSRQLGWDRYHSIEHAIAEVMVYDGHTA
jgi:hypothetical protein